MNLIHQTIYVSIIKGKIWEGQITINRSLGEKGLKTAV